MFCFVVLRRGSRLTRLCLPGLSTCCCSSERVKFPVRAAEWLEDRIDVMSEHLPPLKNFILPSGGKASTHLHVARSMCRRAERAVVRVEVAEGVDPEVLKFLNRLSDYLFTAARFASNPKERGEIVYKKP
mmetsp:Transcript_32888/g.84932  ORF Transcript_32888/g.84932 Transcript_32888/m.84932 type:complete len:130 (-) Transcript_32888:587-976(-)